MTSCDVVIPTLGRSSLGTLLAALASQTEPLPGRVVLVDDRREQAAPLLPEPAPPGLEIDVVAGATRGPAAARNLGWRTSAAEWIAFLDDDVVPPPDWAARLRLDLDGSSAQTAGVQGAIQVPLPADRRPTDWERNVAGLAAADWPTADMAYRRAALVEVGGFDERFPRAFREDADLALRVLGRGWHLRRGGRSVCHPVRPAPWWVSIAKQAGNADDAVMGRLHGPDWRLRAGAPAGAFRRHVVATAAGVAAVGAIAAGRPRAARAAGAAWALAVARFTAARIAPGPRTPGEIAAMVATSAAIPPLAVWHRAAGALRARRIDPVAAAGGRPTSDHEGPATVDAVLFDRDGTLVVDVPYNGDPGRVVPVPGAARQLDRLREAGVRLAIISNQSGVSRGLISRADVDRVNARVAELLGPFDAVFVCEHGPDDGCDCRKPRPGMVLKAAAELGVAPERCAVVGDIGADVAAGLAAGARTVLVPTPETLKAEVAAAPLVAADLGHAVDLLLGVPT